MGVCAPRVEIEWKLTSELRIPKLGRTRRHKAGKFRHSRGAEDIAPGITQTTHAVRFGKQQICQGERSGMRRKLSRADIGFGKDAKPRVLLWCSPNVRCPKTVRKALQTLKHDAR